MPNKIYTIKQSEYVGGGFKVKCNGDTIGQLPTLEQALKQCQSLVSAEIEEIEYTDKNGKKQMLDLFGD